METPGSAGPQKPQAHAEHQPQARPDVAGSAAQISFERLKQYPLFAKLPDSTLSKLQLHVREERFEAGQTILRAGAYNADAFYIAEGLVEIKWATPTATAAVKPMPSRSADAGLLARLHGMISMPRRQTAATPPADATVVLSGMPVDLKGAERAVLSPGEIFGWVKCGQATHHKYVMLYTLENMNAISTPREWPSSFP